VVVAVVELHHQDWVAVVLEVIELLVLDQVLFKDVN
jgi:hypothetical protein